MSGSSFYVSPSGSDSNNGKASAPFATLAKAETAMEASSTIHTTTVDAGTYTLTSALAMTSKDSGFSFVAASGAKPIVTGSATNLISANGASNVTLSGLTFQGDANGPAVLLQNGSGETITDDYFNANQEGVRLIGTSYSTATGNEVDNSALSAFEVQDGSNYDTFDSNKITGTGAQTTNGGGFYLHGANNATITHNAISNTQGAGISLSDFDNNDTRTQNNNADVEWNTVTNANQASGATDSGGIYVLGRSLVQTGDKIGNNLVSSPGPNGHNEGIYLDDNTSGVAVFNNIVTGLSPHSEATELHGGNNDSFTNNIFDLGSNGGAAALIQGDEANEPNPNQLTKDSYSGNVIITNGNPALPSWLFINAPTTAAAITNNDYWEYGGKALNTYPDSSAKYSPPASSYGQQVFATSGDGIGFTQINQSGMGLHPTGAHWY